MIDAVSGAPTKSRGSFSTYLDGSSSGICARRPRRNRWQERRLFAEVNEGRMMKPCHRPAAAAAAALLCGNNAYVLGLVCQRSEAGAPALPLAAAKTNTPTVAHTLSHNPGGYANMQRGGGGGYTSTRSPGCQRVSPGALCQIRARPPSADIKGGYRPWFGPPAAAEDLQMLFFFYKWDVVTVECRGGARFRTLFAVTERRSRPSFLLLFLLLFLSGLIQGRRIFFIHAGLRKHVVWPGDQQRSFGDTSMGAVGQNLIRAEVSMWFSLVGGVAQQKKRFPL
ncbi:unnamed protein product [Pleuronectes platessa]|uniref:Uncharacterized protein n=1 Tax=Pleuronectes platessa TaxID=8262 RepID=A0A9N7YQX5_PLEPL|nr:unnamed protein product [Pleuronectes platessa]